MNKNKIEVLNYYFNEFSFILTLEHTLQVKKTGLL